MTGIQKEIEFPYQNKSLTTIKGEIWKEIPGLDGQYLASNFGRIKALSRFILKINAEKGYWTKERIMTQTASFGDTNPHTKQTVRFLHISIRFENRMYPFTVARLIYNLFI